MDISEKVIVYFLPWFYYNFEDKKTAAFLQCVRSLNYFYYIRFHHHLGFELTTERNSRKCMFSYPHETSKYIIIYVLSSAALLMVLSDENGASQKSFTV